MVNRVSFLNCFLAHQYVALKLSYYFGLCSFLIKKFLIKKNECTIIQVILMYPCFQTRECETKILKYNPGNINLFQM